MQHYNNDDRLPVASAGRKRRVVSVFFSLMLIFGLGACGGDPTGMQRPIDGSSVSAFEQTEQILRTELTAAQYSEYNSSLNYLQLKAFEAPTIADFYLTLDGKTPEQIIAEADAARAEN